MATGAYFACNSIWLLDDFTEQNVPTPVIPGSHRRGNTPLDLARKRRHREVIQLLEQAHRQ